MVTALGSDPKPTFRVSNSVATVRPNNKPLGAAVLVLSLMTACGGSTPASESAAPDSSESTDTATPTASSAPSGLEPVSTEELDPCALLDEAEVEELIGLPVTEELGLSGVECQWSSGTAELSDLFVTVKDFRGLEDYARDSFGEGDPVEGIGEDAYLEENEFNDGVTLTILDGGFIVHIGTYTGQIDALEVVAPTVLTRLP